MDGINEHISVRQRDNLIQFCIPTSGCKLGKCIFCNYGKTQLIPITEVINSLATLLDSLKGKNFILLLNAIGSLLDPNEVPFEYIESMCKVINNYDNIKLIVIETHYMTINESVLLSIRKLLPNKNISIEIGLETCNPEYQRFIRKNINPYLLKEKVELTKKYNMDIEANVFLGIPFIGYEYRINDAIKTIEFALLNGFAECTLFPCNLKENTDLKILYDAGQYNKVSHFEVLQVLDKVKPSLLNRISVSWYGDWIQMENHHQINEVPLVGLCEKIPYDLEMQLTKVWASFYKEYRQFPNERKQIVEKYKNILYPMVGLLK